MQIFLRVADLLAKAGLVIAGAILVGIVCLILTEIVARSVFNTSTFVMTEFVAEGVAGTTFFALAYALRTGAILRMNLVVERLGPLGTRMLDLVTILSGLAVSLFLIYFAWIRLARSWSRGTTSSSVVPVPVWVPEGFVFLGLLLVVVQVLALLLRNLSGEPLPRGNEQTTMEE